MKVVLIDSPNPRLWPVGTIFTIEQVAQLTECNAEELAKRIRKTRVLEEQGFQFQIRNGSSKK